MTVTIWRYDDNYSDDDDAYRAVPLFVASEWIRGVGEGLQGLTPFPDTV